jgi:hypothetical protein
MSQEEKKLSTIKEDTKIGQCIKCGKKTDNQYTYYSGDIARSHSTISGNRVITTTTIYKNLALQSEFVCTKCVKSNISGHWLSYLFGSIVFFSIPSFFLYSRPIDELITVDIIAFFLMFAVGGIVSAIKAVSSYRSVQNDKPVIDPGVVDIWLIKEAKKANPKKEYFTVSQYQKLEDI